MLRRARIWLEIALVAAMFGFTGLLKTTAIFAQIAFYVCVAFSVFSLLLSLFEEASESRLKEGSKELNVVPIHDLLPQLEEKPQPEQAWAESLQHLGERSTASG